MRAETIRRLRPFGPALAFAGLAGIVQAVGYWPGLMTWDAVRQYGEAVDGAYDDWHPPAMDWLWRQLIPIHVGPGPMMVIQLLLYWGGYALLVGAMLRRGRTGLATGLLVCALLPIPLALMGAILKDCLMAGALLMATGLLAWCRPGRDGLLRAIGVALLIAAATLRFNAFLACAPLLVALLPEIWRRGPWRLGAVSLIAGLALVAALPAANRALEAEPSGVGLSLVIFDLGGITHYSGIDAFPPIGVADAAKVNRGCYSTEKWDTYSFWTPTPCPITFEKIQTAFERSGESPYRYWIGRILAHPIAYATHRLTHFNLASRFLIPADIYRPVPNEPAPTEGNFPVPHNAALDSVDRIAVLSGETPLGWPIWWLGVALGCLIVAPALPSRAIIVPLALSALLYGFGYLGVSVAAEIRYHLWTMMAAAIALAVVLADLGAGATPSRRIAIAAAAPAVIVTLLCLAWRIL